MRSDDAEDTELVRRFHGGDEQEFVDLVRQFEYRIVRLCAVWLADAQLVDDAAQEVFLRIYRGLRRFRFQATPFTWLYRTTRNVCHEFNRKRTPEPLPEDLRDDGADVADRIERYRAARRVRAAVAALPQRQQDAVILRLFEDCSVRETARIMGCREGTVKALLHQAKERLRESFTFPETDT